MLHWLYIEGFGRESQAFIAAKNLKSALEGYAIALQQFWLIKFHIEGVKWNNNEDWIIKGKNFADYKEEEEFKKVIW